MPTASEVTVKETLDLLDGRFQPVAEAICNGGYAFWLGSGVSRDRVVGLDGVLAKLLEFLRVRAVADPAGAYATGLEAILTLAALPEAARRAIDLNRPVSEWIGLDVLINALWRQYSAVKEAGSAGFMKNGDVPYLPLAMRPGQIPEDVATELLDDLTTDTKLMSFVVSVSRTQQDAWLVTAIHNDILSREVRRQARGWRLLGYSDSTPAFDALWLELEPRRTAGCQKWRRSPARSTSGISGRGAGVMQ